jgi:hypothetical protein
MRIQKRALPKYLILVERLFIEAAIHQNGFSSKQLFIESTYSGSFIK